MKSRYSAVLAALVALAGCKKTASEPSPPPQPSASATPTADTHHLDDAATRALAEIAKLETTKDVTCWTSFRQLDAFISSNVYSNFAVLAKINAVKALVRASWEKASLASPRTSLTAADFDGAASLDGGPGGTGDAGDAGTTNHDLASFAAHLGMKAYQD